MNKKGQSLTLYITVIGTLIVIALIAIWMIGKPNYDEKRSKYHADQKIYQTGYNDCKEEVGKFICLKFKDKVMIEPETILNDQGVKVCHNNCSDIWTNDIIFHFGCMKYY